MPTLTPTVAGSTTKRVTSQYTVSTSEAADILGISQRSIQRYALEGNVDARFDGETNRWMLHRDYLNPDSKKSVRLLRAFGTGSF